jgi:hypothetical protein
VSQISANALPRFASALLHQGALRIAQCRERWTEAELLIVFANRIGRFPLAHHARDVTG